MYKPFEDKIKTYENKNFGEVSPAFDLTPEKIQSMFAKFIGTGQDSSQMFDFIRTEQLNLIQERKQYCKEKKEEI